MSFSLEDQSFDQDVVVKKPKAEKHIKQYLLGSAIGQGSYAKVREAYDTQMSKRVAIKIIRKRQLTRIPRGLAHVREEIEILELLQKHPHENVVRFIEWFEESAKDKLYLVFAFYEGGTVDALLRRSESGRVPLGQARQFAAALFAGLAHLHAQQVLHRDLKPDNLLLDLRGRLVISDFGVAELTQNNTASGSAGSPAFLPPEIVRGAATYAADKVDVWAAGVTLFFIITGSYPFNTQSLAALIESTAAGTVQMPESLDAQTAALLRALLTVDPAERPGIEQILQHAWFAAPLDSEPDLKMEATPSSLPANLVTRRSAPEAPSPQGSFQNRRDKERRTRLCHLL